MVVDFWEGIKLNNPAYIIVAQEHIVKIGNSLKVFWSLSEINRDLVVTQRRS